MKKPTLADIAREDGVSAILQQNCHNSQFITHNSQTKKYLRTTITLSEEVFEILTRESMKRKHLGKSGTHTAIVAEALISTFGGGDSNQRR
jgi:hypothetical protein